MKRLFKNTVCSKCEGLTAILKMDEFDRDYSKGKDHVACSHCGHIMKKSKKFKFLQEKGVE